MSEKEETASGCLEGEGEGRERRREGLEKEGGRDEQSSASKKEGGRGGEREGGREGGREEGREEVREGVPRFYRSKILGAITTRGFRKGLRSWRLRAWKYWAGVVQFRICMFTGGGEDGGEVEEEDEEGGEGRGWSLLSCKKRSRRAEECSGPAPS